MNESQARNVGSLFLNSFNHVSRVVTPDVVLSPVFWNFPRLDTNCDEDMSSPLIIMLSSTVKAAVYAVWRLKSVDLMDDHFCRAAPAGSGRGARPDRAAGFDGGGGGLRVLNFINFKQWV